jgi:hypothetical protein
MLDRRAETRVAQRVAAHRPLPGSDAALRRLLTEGGSFGDITADPATMVQTMNFLGVDGIGWDRYAVADREWRIFLSDDGVIHGLTRIDPGGFCHSSEPYECRDIATNGPNLRKTPLP